MNRQLPAMAVAALVFSQDQAEAVTDVAREASQVDVFVLATIAEVAATKADLQGRDPEMYVRYGRRTDLVILGALVTLPRVGLRP